MEATLIVLFLPVHIIELSQMKQTQRQKQENTVLKGNVMHNNWTLVGAHQFLVCSNIP